MKLRIAIGVVLLSTLLLWYLHSSQSSTRSATDGVSSAATAEPEVSPAELAVEPAAPREVIAEDSVADPTGSTHAAIPEEWSIVGTVIDEGNRPISGAVVVPDSNRLVHITTDTRGGFRFAAPDSRPLTQLRSFAVTHPDFLGQRANVELGDEFYANHTAAVTIVLRQGLTVSVLVIDELSQPVVGAYVRVRGIDEDPNIIRPNPWISQREWQSAESNLVSAGIECSGSLSDAGGLAKLQVSKPAGYMLIAWKAGYLTEPDRMWDVTGAGNTETYVLRRGLEISGIVLDNTELTVPGVSIVVETMILVGGKYQRHRASTTTDELGRFTIAGLGLDPKRTTLTAHHPTRGAVIVRIANPTEPQTVLLVPHLEVRLRLLDSETNSPIEGTAMLAWARKIRDDGSSNTVGAREHEFQVTNGELSATVPRFIGAATLAVAGYDDVDIDLKSYATLASLDRTLELRRQLRYEVRIIDAATGNPIRGATVQLGCAWLNAEGMQCSSLAIVSSEWRDGAEVFVLEGVQLRQSQMISLSAFHAKFKNKSLEYKSQVTGELIGDVVLAMERLP